MPWELPRRKRGQGKSSSGTGRVAAAAVVVLTAAGIITVGALSIRAAAMSGVTGETDLAVPALVGTAIPLLILALGWLRLRRRMTAIVLAFTLGLGTNVVFLAHAVPAAAVTDNSSVFTFKRTTAFNPPQPDMLQNYTPAGSSTTCPAAAGFNWACSWTSDTFASGQTMNAGTAQVDLYASNNPVPVLRYDSNLVGGGNTVCTLNKPPTLLDGDVMLAACSFRGGTGTTITSVPAGWTLVGSRVDNGTTISLVVYSHVVTDAASEPATYSWNFSASVKYSRSLVVYSGIDNANPIDVTAGVATASGTSHAAPALTTTVSNDMLVTFHVTATCTAWTPPAGMTERSDDTFCSQGATSNVDMETNETLLGSAGAVGPWTATDDSAAVGLTKSVALRRDTAPKTCDFTVQLSKPILYRSSASAVVNSGTSITINKPAGLVDGDVMVASIGFSSGGATITPQDAGWTFVSRAVNGAGASVAVYVQVASGEPANYTWDLSAALAIGGTVTAYTGVDTTTPVDTSGISSNGTTTASISTAQPGEMLVASFFGWTNGSASTWTPPAGMTERVDVTTTAGFYSFEMAEALQPLAGATGAKVATPTPSIGSGASHILALRPKAGSLLGSVTAGSTSPGGPTLVSVPIATPAVTFADGERLQVTVMAPNDQENCAASVSYDGASERSKLTVATIVPEGVAGLLLLAPALPIGLRWWKRRRP
jgi:hypothetical protein